MPAMKSDSVWSDKFAIGLALALVLLQLLGASWVYFSSQKRVWSAIEANGDLHAQGLAIAMSEALLFKNYASAEDRGRQTMVDHDINSVWVTDPTGRVLLHLKRMQGGRDPVLVLENSAITPPTTESLHQHSIHGGLITFWAPIELDQPLGWVKLEISLDDAKSALGSLQREAIVLALLGILGSLLPLLYWLRRNFKKNQEYKLQLRTENRQLEKMASSDPLTGLANRRVMMDRLQQAISRTQRRQQLLAICFLDLDGFKQVNDQYGHEMGDLLLKEVARRLSEIARTEDTIARLGGDEFVLLFEGGRTVTDYEGILDRVISAIAEPVRVNGHQVTVGASIGVTYFPLDDTDPSSLLNHADSAMYEAKRSGRQRWKMYETRPVY